jgi:predicted PurR-regulated permease PerM
MRGSAPDQPQDAPAAAIPKTARAASRRQPPTSSTSDHSAVSVRALVTAALIVLAIIALVFLLSQIIGIVLLVLVAIVFAEGIRPLVERLRRRRLPPPLAIIVIYLALILFFGVLIALLVQPIVSEARSLADNFPTYQKHFLSFFNNLEQQFHFNVDVSKQVTGALGAAQQVLFTIGATIFGIVIDFVLILVVGFLWLVSTERLKRFTLSLFPERHQALANNVFAEIGYRMGGYLRAVAINSVAVAVATGLASTILGLPSPILLGIFAGLTAAVPLVGPFIGIIPPVLLAFTVSPAYPVLVLAVMLVVQLIDANTVVPLVMNRVVALPALAVVLALLIGGTLQGFAGALLAVPVAAALQVIILRVLVPAIYHAQGRDNQAYAAAYSPLTPHLKATAPRGGGRRLLPR